MPRRRSRSHMQVDDDNEFIYAPSSSSEEDWGEGTWEVDGIEDEHVNTRGEVRLKVAWGGWQRNDGSNWTWESEDGTTMADVPALLRQWRRLQAIDADLKAENPAVPPFTVSVLHEEPENAPEGKKKKSKKPAVARYAFTEQSTQAREMAVDLINETDFEQSSSLASAHARLRDLREKRESALKDLDTTLPEAPSQSLYGLGAAPQKEGCYRAQKKVPLHWHMQSLHVSKPATKGPIDSGGSKDLVPARPARRAGPSGASAASPFDFTLNRQAQPAFKDLQVANRAARPSLQGSSYSGGFKDPVRARPPSLPEPSGASAAAVSSFEFTFNRQAQPGFKHPQVPNRAACPLPQRLPNRGSQPQSVTARPHSAMPPHPPVHSNPWSARLVGERSDTSFNPSFKSVPRLSSSIMSSINPGSITLPDAKRRRKIPSTSSVPPTLAAPRGQIGTGSVALSNTMSPRDSLQAKWSKAIRAAGAAAVTFANDFNDDEIPVLDINRFIYLESNYIFGSGVPRSQEDFMEACDCNNTCSSYLCACQEDSEIIDEEDGSKTFAYDAKGVYTFGQTLSYVIECNKARHNCKCGPGCQSRIAQSPRRFPIEVFRTERCGWGVRSPVALPKGSVLGVYTGELIARETARTFSIKRASYLFDLDFMDAGSQTGYSVDAYNCGNWTRFVNHSCSPVCSLYSVIWDSVPSMHQPKLAFVASVDIPAHQELSIDYCPQAKKGKGKARAKAPGTPDCMCGAEDCRGFIYLS